MAWVDHSNNNFPQIFCECLGTQKIKSHVTHTVTNKWQQKFQVWPLTVKEMATFIREKMSFTVAGGNFPSELPLAYDWAGC